MSEHAHSQRLNQRCYCKPRRFMCKWRWDQGWRGQVRFPYLGSDLGQPRQRDRLHMKESKSFLYQQFCQNSRCSVKPEQTFLDPLSLQGYVVVTFIGSAWSKVKSGMQFGEGTPSWTKINGKASPLRIPMDVRHIFSGAHCTQLLSIVGDVSLRLKSISQAGEMSLQVSSSSNY